MFPRFLGKCSSQNLANMILNLTWAHMITFLGGGWQQKCQPEYPYHLRQINWLIDWFDMYKVYVYIYTVPPWRLSYFSISTWVLRPDFYDNSQRFHECPKASRLFGQAHGVSFRSWTSRSFDQPKPTKSISPMGAWLYQCEGAISRFPWRWGIFTYMVDFYGIV